MKAIPDGSSIFIFGQNCDVEYLFCQYTPCTEECVNISLPQSYTKLGYYINALMSYRNNIFIFHSDCNFSVFDVCRMSFHQTNYVISTTKNNLIVSRIDNHFVFREKFYLRLQNGWTAVKFAVFDPNLFLNSVSMKSQPYVLDTITCDTDQFNDDVFYSND